VLPALAIAGAFAPPVRRADTITPAANAAATVHRARAGRRACLVCNERARCATTATRRLDPARAVWIDLCRAHYWQLVDELLVRGK
jgi:hypothetical protein